MEKECRSLFNQIKIVEQAHNEQARQTRMLQRKKEMQERYKPQFHPTLHTDPCTGETYYKYDPIQVYTKLQEIREECRQNIINHPLAFLDDMIARKGPDSPDTSGSSSSFKNLNQQETKPNSDPTSIREEYQQFAVQNPIFHPQHPLAFLDNRINHDAPNKTFSSPPTSCNKRKQEDSDSISTTFSEQEKAKKEFRIQQQREHQKSHKRWRKDMQEHNHKYAHAPCSQVLLKPRITSKQSASKKQGDSDSVSSHSSDWSVTKINQQLEEWVLNFEKEKKELRLQQQKEQEE